MYAYLDDIYSDVNPYFGLDTKGAIVRGIQAINVSIFNVLTTPYGTRYRQPDYGSYIPFILQELPSDDIERQLKNYSIRPIETWCPRAQVIKESVEVNPLKDGDGYNILIPYYAPDINRRASFSANFTLQ